MKYKIEEQQEIYKKNLREAQKIGITSRFTAYLMYRCEMMSSAQERAEKGRTYWHKDLIKI